MAALRAPAPVRRQDRTTTEVILDHLDCRRRNALDDDLARNYAGEVTVISRRGASAGPSAVRTEAAFLGDALPDMRFRVTSLVGA